MGDMDDDARDAVISARSSDVVREVDGVLVAPFREVLGRLRADYPNEDPGRIEAIVLREWEAFSAGRPLVVPTAVEDGAREILGPPLV